MTFIFSQMPASNILIPDFIEKTIAHSFIKDGYRRDPTIIGYLKKLFLSTPKKLPFADQDAGNYHWKIFPDIFF